MQKRRRLHLLQRILGIRFLQTGPDQCIIGQITFKDKKKDYVISVYRLPLHMIV